MTLKMTHNETLIGETPLHQYPPKQKPDKAPKLLENLALSNVSTFFILTFLLPDIGPKRPRLSFSWHLPKGSPRRKKLSTKAKATQVFERTGI